MRSVVKKKRGRRVIAPVVAVFVAVTVVAVVVVLASFIDQKLNQSAEQQVTTFTQQAAGNVADRMYIVQNAIGSFQVQTDDPEAIVPALKALQDHFGFTGVAFAGLDGTGRLADGAEFSIDDLHQPETALSAGEPSYSDTFVNEEGVRVRMGQQPLSLDGAQVGALYVQIPLSLFSMPRQLDMFDGRGYFMLFDATTGEILVPPFDGTKTPIEGGTSVFDFLDEASRYRPPETDVSMQETSATLLALQAQQGNDLQGLRDMVDGGKTGFTTALVDDRASYVCVAPVSMGRWYVCSIVPVENVRAEAAVVTTTFEVMFAIIFACLVAVVLVVFITYRRHMRERNVEMMSQLYQALSDSIDIAVNLYSPSDGQITPIVAKAANIIGYSMRDFLKDPHLAQEIELSREGVVLFDRIRAGDVRDFEQGELEFKQQRTGVSGWVAYSVKSLVFDGKPQLLIVLRDTTAEKKIQLSMKDAMQAAEAANQAKSEFLSRMSHEIRTPMNVIIGMLQIAQANVDHPEKTRMSLAKIGAASDHLLNLINDVLDISKIENGKMTLASVPFRLRDVLKDVVTATRAQCNQREQEFLVHFSRQVNALFVGDDMRIKQLLLNLLANAVKYTPQGGHVRFEVVIDEAPVMGYKHVVFVVSDDGIGMSEEFLNHLFEPFAMEGRSREQGTGLGMSIVKNIVTLMGGNLNVQSAMGEGSTFRVELNLRVALQGEACAAGKTSEAEAPDVAESEMPGPIPEYALTAAPHTHALDSAEVKGLRVLVAEDNDLNAEIACELLGEAGLVVDRACDGREACDLFEASEPNAYDVVLMDVQMPRMDGYEATRCIRALPRPDAQTVPIIAMSANAFSEDVRASLESGMNAHLSKPIEMRRVLATIVQFVRKRKS